MKIVFVSNYFNHHQKPFCEEMYQKLGENFIFLSTSTMRAERLKLGYGQTTLPPYVYKADVNPQNCEAALIMIREADVVIAGAAPEEFLAERLRMRKLILRYSERPFKKEPSFLRRMYHSFSFRRRDRGSKYVYMLCAGAYTATDFARMGMYKNRMYQWGYFPAVKEYDLDQLFASKKQNDILWCGRFIDWKHPDDAITLARKLKDAGYEFQLNMIGTGDMEEALKAMTEEYGVTDEVHFLGAMPPEQVRAYMEEAGIYLFTSDRQEGWGAVLNEAMASGCAVVASSAAGSTPFLVQNEKNGIVYQAGNVEMLVEKVQWLLNQPAIQIRLGGSAYSTIANIWNGKIAAERLLHLVEQILQEGKQVSLFEDGPCSITTMVSNTL